ncbi:citrate lyase subunit alpha, partial [Escherichia coli]|uniref:citrate lyase subunit alpha n=1 Tax=Escherichia coli TaxID=562 RepID=UPI00258733DF
MRADLALGGIPAPPVDLHPKRLTRKLPDVPTFASQAAQPPARNPTPLQPSPHHPAHHGSQAAPPDRRHVAAQ